MSKLHLLTIKQIKKLKPKHKDYLISDGDKLYLCIKPSNTKLWVFIYTSPTTNKRRKTSFGIYPTTTLSLARDRAIKYRRLLFNNIDPLEFTKPNPYTTVTLRVTSNEYLHVESSGSNKHMRYMSSKDKVNF